MVVDVNIEVKNNDLVLVDFWAPWCPSCISMMPHVDKIKKEYETTLKVIKVNVAENPNFASQHSVMSLPTFMIFKKGQVVDRFNGSTTSYELQKKVKSFLK
jgi:thioredoxin